MQPLGKSKDAYEIQIWFLINSLLTLEYGVDMPILQIPGIFPADMCSNLIQGLLYTWADSLGTFFATFLVMKMSKNDSNIICRSSKKNLFSQNLEDVAQKLSQPRPF